MSNAATRANALKIAFYRATEEHSLRVVRKGKGWTTEANDNRERAVGLAKQVHDMYLACKAEDAHICQFWAQVEHAAVMCGLITQLRAAIG